MALTPSPGPTAPPPAPPPPPPPAPIAALSVQATLLIGMALFFVMIGIYLASIPAAIRYTVDGTRPVLVFTLIAAMLAFGGLMIAKSLYGGASGDDLNGRFRLAREVFLIYAGTFGTVTGFYFGSAGGPAAAPAPLAVKPSFAAGRLLIAVEGGAAPFLAIVTPAGGASGYQQRSTERTLTIPLPTGAPCPDKAAITLVDGRGQISETVLACPAATAPSPAPSATPSTPAQGNAAG